MFFKSTMFRFRKREGKKWISCLTIVLLLISMLPVTALGALSPSMTIVTTPSAATLTESNVLTSGLTIDINLQNITWADNIASATTGVINSEFIPTLKGGFSAPTDTTQWNNLLGLAGTEYKLVDYSTTRTDLQIVIPGPILASKYNILSDQTVTFSPPPALLQNSSDLPVPAAQSFTIVADPQATLSGSLTNNGVTESDIVAGGKQLTITLVNCQWASDVATDATKRAKLFSALQVATGTDAAQWNTQVYNALVSAPNPSDVITETSSTVVTITLPAVSGYNISSQQVLTVSSLDQTLFTFPSTYTSGNLTNIYQGSVYHGSITINPNTNTISWSPTPALTESLITTTGGGTLRMTLSDNTWANDFGANLARETALLNGFTASTDLTAWNKVKTAILLADSNFVLSTTSVANDTLTVKIPITSDYSISADQLVTVMVPSTVLTNNYPLSNQLTFTITADPAVAVSGTLVNGATEMDIVNGGKTIVATLTNAKWDPSVTIDKTKREQLVDNLLNGAVGIVPADQSAWITDDIPIIKAGATYELSSDHSAVTITLPPVPAFNISGTITITSQVPSGSALIVPSAGLAYTGTGSLSFTIVPVNNQSAYITVPSVTESDIVTGGKTLIITLGNDFWAQDVVSTPSTLDALIAGITPTATGTSWANVQNTIKATNVTRVSNTKLSITLPPVFNYSIDQDQTINVNIPKVALATSTGAISAGSFTVQAVTATLSGTSVTTPLNSAAVVAGGKTIVITLKNATWTSDATSVSRLSDLLSCFTSNSTSTPTNWSQISKNITPQDLSISSSDNHVLTIQLPPIADYTWDQSSEQVTFSIASSLFPKFINESLGTAKTLTSSSKVQIGQTVQAVTATLSGNMTVSEVVQGGKQITVTLVNGSWDPKLPSTSSEISALVNGFTASSDSASWTKVQSALKSSAAIFALSASNTVLTITLPPVPSYDPANLQIVKLIIPKAVLISATDNVSATGTVQISLPLTVQGTLQAMLDDGSFANSIDTVPLDKIYLGVPVKYLTSVAVNQTSIGNTTINSLDCYTDSSVTKVIVTVNGTPYTSSTSVFSGNGKKFNVGFATLTSSAGSTGSSTSAAFSDATISVQDSGGNNLQSDVVIKLSGSKTSTFAPTTDLSGAYSLYRLVTNNSLLVNILKYYLPVDIKVETA